jgi:putative nucleotidyltransferase with HDIG domain
MFKTFRTKLALALVFSMLFAGALSNFVIYKYALNSQFNALRANLEFMAQTTASTIDPQMLMKVPLNRDGIDSPEFKIIAKKLENLKRINPSVKYVYTMAKTDKESILQFIVDPDFLEIGEGRVELTSYPGDEYDATHFPEMLKAFSGSTADRELGRDKWGVFLSGYSPIKDESGNTVAILGVDVSAGEVYAIQKGLHITAGLILFLGIILSLFLALLISKGIANPIKHLVDEIRDMASGNLKHRVEVKGHDEISELARSFNQMAKGLDQSREKIVNYFYSVVQSFVRMLEARDKYTKGHSERVAEYAEKIASKMGFSQEKATLLKELGLLHDIGKLGVGEEILNKKEKLTEAEWRLIRKHSSLGEEILKPILLNEELVNIIKGHHERYDGKGYPDGLSGDKIHIFSAIIAAADAYDAMTSPRAYRSSLNKEEAIKELERNKGTQFNPKVVDAFLEILKKEDTKT